MNGSVPFLYQFFCIRASRKETHLEDLKCLPILTSSSVSLVRDSFLSLLMEKELVSILFP